MSAAKERAVIGIDPGNCTGVAVGLDGRLTNAYALQPKRGLTLPFYMHPEWVHEHGLLCVLEYPRFYGVKSYGGDPKATGVANALIREAVTLGGFAEQARKQGARVLEVAPRIWKGTMRKDAMVERIKGRLDADERAIVEALGLPPSKVHNVYDAVGIFLWAVGRLGKKWSV